MGALHGHIWLPVAVALWGMAGKTHASYGACKGAALTAPQCQPGGGGETLQHGALVSA